MKVFGLQGAVYRAAGWASRLTAQTSEIVAGRRDALARFARARQDGLSAAQAARAVGPSRATLDRWAKRVEPRSRRPWRARAKRRPPAQVRAEGFAASNATVGRIIRELVKRGVVDPVPTLRRRPHLRRWSAKRRFAQRFP